MIADSPSPISAGSYRRSSVHEKTLMERTRIEKMLIILNFIELTVFLFAYTSQMEERRILSLLIPVYSEIGIKPYAGIGHKLNRTLDIRTGEMYIDYYVSVSRKEGKIRQFDRAKSMCIDKDVVPFGILILAGDGHCQ